jgi:uncharacterized protein
MRQFVHRLSAALVCCSVVLYAAVAALATANAGAAELPAHTPHVALILPLASPSFSRHADAVKQGFLAAAKVAGANAPPVRIYAANEDTLNVLTVYEQAVESGAQLVVGPLTRNGVSALAASTLVTVPTLALNAPEARSPQPARLYVFGLGVELETRQIAQFAFNEGRRNAFVIADDSALGRRMRQAFVEEFSRLGGAVVAEFGYAADAATLNRLRSASTLGVADMVFFALDYVQANQVRPYLGNALALYATSQVNAARNTLAARELNLVRFVDMPWVLQPDHPAVMVYPRPSFGDSADFDRLYALGIDAFRLGIEILRRNRDPHLDGVTGRIRLGRDQQFGRELTDAQFVDGKIVVIGEPQP